MKNILQKILIISSIILAASVVPLKASAQDDSYSEFSRAFPYVAAGDVINIQRNDTGDAYVGANEIDITQPVTGNLFLAAKKIVINAPVTGSIYAAAEQIEIRSQVTGSFAFAADTVYISSTGEIAGDAYGAAAKFNHEGRIGRNLNLSLSPDTEITINGKIIGDFEYNSSKANITDKAYVGGTKKNTSEPKNEQDEKKVQVLYKIYESIFLIIAGLILLKGFPRLFSRLYQKFTHPTVKGVLFTLLFLFIMPVLLVVLLVSVIGIPLILFFGSIVLFAYMFASLPAGMWIGQKLFKPESDPEANPLKAKSLILGILIYSLLTLIPVLGGLISTFTFILFISAMFRLAYRLSRG